MILSNSQQEALKKFEDFLQSKDSEFVLTGAAGTGKTTLLKIFKDINQKMLSSVLSIDPKGGWDTVWTATTNKACQVLTGIVKEPTNTIHSFLGLKVKNDLQTGKTRLVPMGTLSGKLIPMETLSQIPRRTVIFIDEASMVSKELLRYIRLAKGENAKIVFIGDPYQLAPVGEGNSIVFRRPPLVAKLREVHRQALNSPIIDLAHEYRKMLDSGSFTGWPELKNQLPHIESVNGSEFQELIHKGFKVPEDAHFKKILTWTNKSSIAYNNYVRHLFTNSVHFQVGEEVVLNNPIIRNNTIILQSDQSYMIVDMKESTTLLGVEGWLIQLSGYNQLKIKGFRFGTNHFFFAPKNWADAAQTMKRFAKEKNWQDYFEIKDNWLDLRAPYSCTVHKSQGHTYDEVFIDVTDIGENKNYKEVARLMYVAITRASKRVYLRGHLPIRNFK